MPKMDFKWEVEKRETRRREWPEKPEPIEPNLKVVFYGYNAISKVADMKLVEENATVKFLIQPSVVLCVNNTPMMKITEREKGK